HRPGPGAAPGDQRPDPRETTVDEGNPSMSQTASAAAGGKPAPVKFTPYQTFVVAVLAFLQFTIVLDFMILSPLGALLMRDLHIPAARFGFLVSVYAFSAGISGLLAGGLAESFR